MPATQTMCRMCHKGGRDTALRTVKPGSDVMHCPICDHGTHCTNGEEHDLGHCRPFDERTDRRT